MFYKNDFSEIEYFQYCFSTIIFIFWLKMIYYLRFIEKLGIFFKVIQLNFKALFTFMMFTIFILLSFSVVFENLFFDEYRFVNFFKILILLNKIKI